MEERFWAKVSKDAQHPKGCWEWQASRIRGGYGQFMLPSHVLALAHRVAFELEWGVALQQWPWLCVLHECDNPPCVNPAHLTVGDNKRNTEDCVAKGRGGGSKRRGDRNGKRTKPNAQPPQCGSANGASKLNEWQVIGVMARSLQGVSQGQIAREFRISQTHARDIISSKYWAHLFAPEQGGTDL